MDFKTPELREQFEASHPEVVAAWLDAEAFCLAEGLAVPLVTDCARSRSEQRGTYVDIWGRIYRTLLDGKPLTEEQRKAGWALTSKVAAPWDNLLKQLLRGNATRAKVEEARQSLDELDKALGPVAERKPSTHLHLAGVDVRVHGGGQPPRYTPEGSELLHGHLRERCKGPLWEVLLHVGTGLHLHVGLNDPKWNALHPPKE